MSNYTEYIPQELARRLNCLGMKRTRIPLNFTYGEVFDWFSSQKSIVITLEPFFTFSLNGHIGYTWKISYIDDENGEMKTVTENDVWTSGQSYGGSFKLAANDAIKNAILYEDSKGIQL